MAKHCKECPGDMDELSFHLEEIYGNAQGALRYGPAKESVLSQIWEAFNEHENLVSQDGWLIKADSEALISETK
jgi:hypothetical protein